MKLSVVVPTFNRPDALCQLLQSICAADLPGAMEVLICDDGSTDDIGAAIAPFGHRLKLKYFRQQRLGPRPASARNIGIRAASGDVILFLDDDVTFGKEFLRAHIEAHDPNQAPR